MHIAICDDNPTMSQKLKDIVTACFPMESTSSEITVFESGEELVKQLEKKIQFQIYLLDIELKAMSGLEIARFIRKNDYNAIIIFVTSHRELMQEAFEVQAFHYIVKPFDEWKTKRVILKAVDVINLRKTLFHFNVGKQTYSEKIENIVFFESKGRKFNIYTEEHTIACYGTIKTIMEQVGAQVFVRIHKSFIINIEYLKTIEDEYVIMVNGRRLPLSQKYYAALNDSYRNFIIMRS